MYSRFGHPSIPPKAYDAILAWEDWMKGHSLDAQQIKNIYTYMDANVGYLKGCGPRSKTFSKTGKKALCFRWTRLVLNLVYVLWKGDGTKYLGKLIRTPRYYILNALKRGDNVRSRA